MIIEDNLCYFSIKTYTMGAQNSNIRGPTTEFIMLTCPCDVPLLYIVKLGFTGVYIFLYFCLTEAVLTCIQNLCFEQK